MWIGSKNRAGWIGGLVAATMLCGIAAWTVIRWPEVEFELGYAYENGSFQSRSWRAIQSYPRAAYWLNKAALAGHPRAQYRLGILYAHGWGVPRDAARALQWFTRAGQNTYVAAQYHLGWMYLKGDGVVRNHPQAIHWFEQAGAQGMVAAHLALGRYYEHGYYEHSKGVPTNTVEALKAYELAVHFAHTQPDLFDNAAFSVRAQTARDALAARLSPASIQQAHALAKAWLARRQAKTPA